jgi:hypothetical protein
MNTLAKTYVYKFLTTLVIVNSIGCGNSQQDSRQGNKMDTASNQTLKNKTDMITQKITPCLWVDSDAKAVVDYYLSIFKDGKMKEYHRYENPPEAKEQGGQDSFETAIMQIGEVQ